MTQVSETITQSFAERLARNIQGDVLFDDVSRALYSSGADIYQVFPKGIVVPKSREDVVAAVLLAKEFGVPITSRGAASSLAGQVVGDGLILDFSKEMNHILSVDVEHGRARIQPGVIHGTLNRHLAQWQLFFPPDPSSGDYATMGGVVSNNAAGAHTVKYGQTVDYVTALEVVTAEGEVLQLREYELDSEEYSELESSDTTLGRLHREVRALVEPNLDLIRSSQPEATKNSAGYRLERVIDPIERTFNLARLLTGSESTLGIITEIEVRVVRKPPCRGVILFQFDSINRAGDAVLEILPMAPSALEIMEKHALGIIAKHRPELAKYLPAGTETILFVEFEGETQDEVEAPLEECRRKIRDERALAFGHELALDARGQALLWAVRKATLPIMYNLRGEKKVTDYIEDVAIAPARIPEYIREFLHIISRHQLETSLYGHAGNGNFHTDPMLDLKKQSEVEKMRASADDVFDLAIRMKGTISGEHGDGLVRSPYLKKLYPDIYPLFVGIKNLFDPGLLLNPGKKITSAETMKTDQLKYGPSYQRQAIPEHLVHQHGIAEEAEKCVGCAACRTIPTTTTMCPMFKAVPKESASPRAKANLLRNILSGRLPREVQDTKQYKKTLDLCVTCKMCQIECPAHVNIPKMMLDAKAEYARDHGIPLTERLLVHADLLAKMGSLTAPAANWLNSWGPARRLMELTIGIDRRRTLPKFAWRTFDAWYRKRQNGRTFPEYVVYFTDLYARYHDPSIAIATVEVLEANGIGVIFPNEQIGCGMPAMDYGALELARRTVAWNVRVLEKYVREGYPIVTSEPTAALCLKEEYLDFTTDPAAKLIAENTFELTDFLKRRALNSNLNNDFGVVEGRIGYHAPCHLKALEIGKPGMDLSRGIPGLEVVEIDEGCCGIAGTYGFKKGDEGYNQSMAMGEGLLNALRHADIQYGISECSTCQMQMNHGSGKAAVHPIKLLAEAYRKRQ